MASSLQKIILIALILSIAIPISTGDDENSNEANEWGDEGDFGDESDGETNDGDDSDTGSDERYDPEVKGYLRDLCSDTKMPKQCWKIIKPEINRFTYTDSRDVASVVIGLATEKSKEISDQLKKLCSNSADHELKKKYKSCKKNYDNANEDLEKAKRNLDSYNYGKIRDIGDHVKRDLKSCKRQFGRKAHDPAHIRNMNKEFGRYVEIIKTATKRLVERDEK